MAEAGRVRQSWRRAAAMAFALLLAACQTAGPVRRAPIAPPPPPKAGPAAPISALPEDRERHRVALLVPLSGPNGSVGQSIANAAQLALADTKDRALRVTTYDTGTGATAAATKAIADGNQLILGPLLGEDVRAVAPVAKGAGVPVLAFSNDAGAVSDNVWLLGFQPAQSIDRVVRYAKSRGLTRFAGLVPQGAYGRGAANTLIRAAEAAGGNVVTMQSYERSPKAIGAAVTLLSKQKYDAVLIADSGRVAVMAAPLIRSHGGQDARLLGTELWNAETGLNAAATMAGAWYASVDDAMFQSLAARYKARYGRTPFRLTSLGYDAVLLAVRIARDWKPGAPFPQDRLSDEDGFSGVDGAFRFGSSHLAERALAVHQLGPNGGTVVSPAAAQF
nr:penicillin-binding protein activator [Sphingomonas vulcanisoli]